MRTSEEVGKLMAALAKAQGDLADPHTGATGHHGKYARLQDGLPAARKVLAGHGIAIMQGVRFHEVGPVLVTRLQAGAEWMETDYPVIVNDRDAQKQGAMMTYARRYSLWAALGLAPEDDDAHDASRANARRDNSRPKTKAKPKSKHHPSFTTHQGAFFAKLGTMGIEYKDLAAWCETQKWGRPSGWDTDSRVNLLHDLGEGTPQRATFDAWRFKGEG